MIRAVDNPATLAARPEAPGNPKRPADGARPRAAGPGQYRVARNVLERAAEMGVPGVVHAGETSDPAILSAWEPLARKAMSVRRRNSMPRRLQAAFGRRKIG